MAGWYQACKHALSAVTDALRQELAADGIDVVLVEPGALRSGIWDKGRDDLVARSRSSAAPTAYGRSLRILRALRPFLRDPAAAAEVVGKVDGRPPEGALSSGPGPGGRRSPQPFDTSASQGPPRPSGARGTLGVVREGVSIDGTRRGG